MIPGTLPVLLLHGDAEARLLAGLEPFLQAALPSLKVRVESAWAPRADLLAAEAPAPPASLRRRGLIPDEDPRDLLARPHRLVVLSLLPGVALPLFRHRDGGAFVAHRGVVERWSREESAVVAEQCREEQALPVMEGVEGMEPVIERLQAGGSVVAVCTAFRHVNEPLEHRGRSGPMSLREIVRRTNLEAARLSQRTGCFVLDLDRALAEEGGATLGADCFGGTGRAAEIALDELLGLVLDALPEEAMYTEST